MTQSASSWVIFGPPGHQAEMLGAPRWASGKAGGSWKGRDDDQSKPKVMPRVQEGANMEVGGEGIAHK